MTLYLHNTITRRKERFEPLIADNVRLYLCGPTVYDLPHIGNARSVVCFDILVRLLKHMYPKVTYIRNITDVDDKINAAAVASGESIRTITTRTTAAYHADMATLGTLSPDIEPRATDHIPEMIAMIETLIHKGFAYAADGHVLFKVQQYERYGELSRRDPEELLAGARVEIAPYKQHAGDFVLWKPSDEKTPGWDSPWGRGRPGWHIECSAMSGKYFGATFDIHGGGVDLVFPHHENECAQSCCANDTPYFARYWVHNGLLTVGGEKMSKSLGNFFTVRQVLENHPGEVIRLTLLSSHYRQPLDWNDAIVAQAKTTLDRCYQVLRDCPVTDEGMIDEQVLKSLSDDLNTPLALARLHEITGDFFKAKEAIQKQRFARLLKGSAALLGILQQSATAWFQSSDTNLDSELIEQLIEERKQARSNKDFATADCVRQQLTEMGIVLEDGPQGTTWRRA